MKDQQRAGERRRFFYLLNQSRHVLFKHADRLCRAHLGISTVQLGAIYAIAEQPGLVQKDLARALALRESAVTGLVGRMETAGLIERRADPDDRRVIRLYQTRRARAMRKKAKPLLGDLNAELAHGFTEQELDMVVRFLTTTIDRFARSKK
ncbi:MAG: MarR family transcriptional regulator [Proteobacteria bacterium]|nr:MarR family transcriptional regulator [Pseudomonadota bacterium]